jgi:hypothetical protein
VTNEEIRAQLRASGGDPRWQRVVFKPEDYAPYGEVERDDDYRGDCSCGCRWFQQFDLDWGKCHNPESHRYGLLTWEHQGCPKRDPWPYDPEEDHCL